MGTECCCVLTCTKPVVWIRLSSSQQNCHRHIFFAAPGSGSGSSSGSSNFQGWLSSNTGDFSGYLISFLVLSLLVLGISYYCWPKRTKKCLAGCCFGSLKCCKALSKKAGHRAASKGEKKKQNKKGKGTADSDSDSGSENGSGSDEGKSVKAHAKKGKKRGSSGDRGDGDVDPKVTDSL